MGFGLQDGYIGPSISDEDLRQTLSTAQQLGATWWGDNLGHEVLQSHDPTKWYPEHGDRLNDLLDSYELKPVFTLGRSAACNRPPTESSVYINIADPVWMHNHLTYVRYCVDRWKGKTWELLNEPNNAVSWGSPRGLSAIEYAIYVILVTREIRRTDPTAKIITGGLSPGGTTPASVGVIDAVTYASVLLYWLYHTQTYIDGFGLHAYCADGDPMATGPWNVFNYKSRKIRDMFLFLGLGGNPIWPTVQIYATELGQMSAGRPGLSEQKQSDMTKVALDQWKLWNEGPAILYRLHDDPTSTSFPYYGVLRVDDSRKRVADMLYTRSHSP